MRFRDLLHLATAKEDEESVLPPVECLFEYQIDAVCPFGDIILVVKDERDFLPTARFQVSSCILAMSSKVFKKMFTNPRLFEGQRMRSRKRGEVLEFHITKSPSAMRHFLRLLHHTDPLGPDDTRPLLPSELLDLAMVVDYYDCADALRLPVDALLAKYVGRECCMRDHLLTAAFMLDQPEHFRRFTKEVVSSIIMLQAKTFDQQCLELLPSSLIPSLSIQQGIAREMLSNQVIALIQKFTAACDVVGKPELVPVLLAELEDKDLCPPTFDGIGVEVLCQHVETVNLPLVSTELTIETPDEGDGEELVAWYGAPRNNTILKQINAPTHHDLKDLTKKVRELVVGVCLDCIRKKECRIPHRYRWADTPLAVYRRYNEDQYDVLMDSNNHPRIWEDVW